MGKYLYLQLKRLLRIIVPALLVAAVLFGCLALAYQAVVSLADDDQAQAKIKFGVVGTAGDFYLEAGMLALNTIDSSRFSIGFMQMDEAEAEAAMRRGEIAAFVVIPEGFMDEAMYAVGLVSLLKDEITKMVSDIVIDTQKGIFGTGQAMQEIGLSSGDAEYALTFEYFDFIFSRSRMYAVKDLGLAEEVGLEEYLLGGYPSDRENLEKVCEQILSVRMAANYAYLLTDTAKQAEAEALSLTLCSMLTVPGITEVVKHALLLAWAYGESIVDVRVLLKGNKVPAIKTSGTWQLQLANLIKLGTDEEVVSEIDAPGGLDYQGYVRGLLLMKDKERLSMRSLDLIESNLQIKTDECMTKVEIESKAVLRRGVKDTFSTTYEYK